MRFFIRKINVLLPVLLALSCGVSEDMLSKIDEYNTVIYLTVNSSVATDAYYNNDKTIVTFTSSETDTVIKYTIDGTDPTRTNGTEYTVPLTVENPPYTAGTLEIRAVAYDSNRMSEVQSVTVSVGDGTAAYPYEIATAAQLKNVSDNVNAGTHAGSSFRQVANISLADYQSGEGWVPIGYGGVDFVGSYDGGWYSISDLTINRPLVDYQGLFGNVTVTATLENINLVDVGVTGSNYTGALAGNIAGTSTGVTIQNCSVYGTTSIIGTGFVGGLAGYISNAGVSLCDIRSTGAGITGSSAYIGGFTGGITAGANITDCYAKTNVNVSGSGNSAGGFIGYIDTGCDVKTSFSRGTIANTGAGYSYVGGLAGTNAGSIGDCYSTGDVNSNGQYYGGLAGFNNNGTIVRCYSTGEVSITGTDYGGFTGRDTGGSYTSCYWLKDAGLPVNPSLNDSANIADLAGVDPGDQTQMKNQATYSGWSFGTVWDISIGYYPYMIYETWDFPL